MVVVVGLEQDDRDVARAFRKQCCGGQGHGGYRSCCPWQSTVRALVTATCAIDIRESWSLGRGVAILNIGSEG